MEKRLALKAKTGFDVDKAIANEIADKTPENNGEAAKTIPSTGRRTTTSYKVVNKQE